MIRINQVFKNTVWSSGGNAFMAAVSFFTTIFVVKNLGPSEYGLLQEAIAYFTILLNFENIINPNIFKKELIQKPEQNSEQIVNLGLFIAIISLLLLIFVFGAWVLFGLSDIWFLVGALTVSMCFRVSNGISFYFDSRLETYKSQISLNFGNIVGCIVKYGASIYKPTALFQVLAYPIQYLVTMLTHFSLFKKTKIDFQLKASLPSLKRMILLSLPLFFAGLVEVIQGRISYVYLGAVTNPHDLGIFSASVKLTEPWFFVASAICISFWPRLVETYNSGIESYRRILHFFFGALFYFYLILGFFGWILADWIVPLVLGNAFFESSANFKIQCWTMIPQAMCIGLMLVETNQGMAKIALIRNLAALLFNIIALHTMMTFLGIVGASWAQLLTYTFSGFIMPIFFKKERAALKAMILSPIKSVENYLKP